MPNDQMFQWDRFARRILMEDSIVESPKFSFTPDFMPDDFVWSYLPDVDEYAWALVSADGRAINMQKLQSSVVMPVELTARSIPELCKVEDRTILRMLDNVIVDEHRLKFGANLTAQQVNAAMALIEEHELVVAKVFCNTEMYKWIEGLDWVSDENASATSMSHWWTADVVYCETVPLGSIYLAAPCDYVGAISIRKEQEYLDTGCTERIGAFVRDYSIVKIELPIPHLRFLDVEEEIRFR